METIFGISGEPMSPATAGNPQKYATMVRDPLPPAPREDRSFRTGKDKHHARATAERALRTPSSVSKPSALPMHPATTVRDPRPNPVDPEFLAWLAELL